MILGAYWQSSSCKCYFVGIPELPFTHIKIQTQNTRKICVWMLAILAAMKRCSCVVIHPIFVPAVRKRRNWNATRTFGPAVGSLRLHTLFSIVFVNYWFVMKRKPPIIWLLFSLLALLLSGANSYVFIANRGGFLHLTALYLFLGLLYLFTDRL